MDDRRANTLQYGHLGTASYIRGDQVWEFSRHLGTGCALSLLGRVIVSPAENASHRNLSPYQKNDLLLSKKEDLLLDAHPQLAPSFGVIGHHEASSQALTESVTKFDPLVSSRFVIGHASVVDGDRVTERTIQIVVFASNAFPTSLRLSPLDSENIIRPLDGLDSVKVPVIDYEENTLWSGRGSPIQQVILSEALDEKSVFIAVRFALSAAIFRPLYHSSHPRANDTLEHDNYSNTLDPNLLVEIPNSVTGLDVYADVTFNPWYQLQLALVDCVGDWSVWEIHGRQPHKGHWTAEPGPCGSLATLSEDDLPAKKRDHYDGWATISWVGNVHQLLVCDRRTAAIFRTDIYPPERHVVDLRFERQSEWILGISRSKYDPSHVFVVTTTRVFWLSIASSEHYDGRGEGKYSILLSWRHFRDAEDTSLTLTTTLIQNETYLVLSSRLNAFAQLFRFSTSPEDPTIPVSVSDPSIFLLPHDGPSTDLPRNTPHDAYSRIILNEVENAVLSRPTDPAETLRIIKFMGQRMDSRIVESLYWVATENKDEFGAFTTSDSIIPSTRKGAAFSLSSARAEDDNSIVVDDRDKSIVSSPLHTKDGSLRRVEHRAHHLENWSGLHISICSAIEDSVFGDNTPPQSQSFNGWLEIIRTVFQGSNLERGGLETSQTMLDILCDSPVVNDVDENSREFEAVIKEVSDAGFNRFSRRELLCLPLPWSSECKLSASYSMETQSLNIAGLYDSLVLDWLSPLSEDVPGRARVSKERIIRKILTELVMSRIVIVHHDNMDGLGDTLASSLPISRTAVSNPNHLPSSPPSYPEALGSEDGGFAFTSSQPPSQALPQPTYSTLRRYTCLNAQGSIPKRVATTASHWLLGTDPSAYDWQATIRTVQDDNEQFSERRERRSERRQMQQVERASQPSNASASVPPAVKVGGSQQETLQSGPQVPSSQDIEVAIPMSQVVRGQFGSREASKKTAIKARKKKRAAGF